MTTFLDLCRVAVGAPHVLDTDADMRAFLTDWRGRFHGSAQAVIRPGSTQEVVQIVRLCQEFKVPVVPQGGNTGLVAGAVPDCTGGSIVLVLTRLNKIRNIDVVNNTMTIEAGCILQTVQEAAAAALRLFPLSLAAEGSCTIGGNLATNAGGTAVLRYGNMRELCLGLEVVTAQGEVWSSLRGLRKDNTGYDLRDLLIGSEGTLGIITAAVIKLFPQPKARVTALAAMASPQAALQLLTLAQTACGSTLTGFELMSDVCLQLVAKHFPHMMPAIPQNHRQYVLVELSDDESEQHANDLMEKLFNQAMEQGVVDDAVLATSIAQSEQLWNLREHIPLAQAKEGRNLKHDISLPISQIAAFIEATDALMAAHYPGATIVNFGHLGDGNLHYNVAPPIDLGAAELSNWERQVNRLIYDSVDNFNGSFSAEHGVGTLRREEVRHYKSPVEIRLMEAIKMALDPDNLMNPGKVL
jgi:FAD/FMN-containing dehydrogenase